jgi:hypothetical protein
MTFQYNQFNPHQITLNMPSMGEFCEENNDYFEIEDSQNQVNIHNLITIDNPNNNYSISLSSSGYCLTHSLLKSDALKFTSNTLLITICSSSSY